MKSTFLAKYVAWPMLNVALVAAMCLLLVPLLARATPIEGSPGSMLETVTVREHHGRNERFSLEPVLCIAHPGQALEFSLTGMGTPMVAQRVVSLFEPLGLQQEVQFIPAQVAGRPEPYFILNALRIIRAMWLD